MEKTILTILAACFEERLFFSRLRTELSLDMFSN